MDLAPTGLADTEEAFELVLAVGMVEARSRGALVVSLQLAELPF